MSNPTTTRTPNTGCPTCNYNNIDSASPLDPKINARPKPGDLSVCLNCGEILVFNADLTLRLPTIDDAVGWDTEVFQQASKAQRLVRKRGRFR